MDKGSGNIVFFSSCPEKWGGSEELWAQTAGILAERGYKVHIYKLDIDFEHPRIRRLAELGCRITDLSQYLPSLVRRLWNRFLPYNVHRTLPFYIKRTLAANIRRLRPELLVVSQGSNFDGLPFIQLCPLGRTPYVIISQKAIRYLYPNDWTRGFKKEIWRGSRMNYFVSEDNLRITEEQFGMRLDNAEIVRNPYLAGAGGPLAWDFDPDGKVSVACVGRYYLLDKGQDILVNVLSRRKWRERNIELSFYGKGVNEEGLRELVACRGLENVRFRGHTADVGAIWREHQALVLPSRNEGLPLVLVEAMLCGRVPVVTDVGGSREVVRDNETGFIAAGPDERSFDEALERAWQRRAEWSRIGRDAAASVRELVPEDPARVFAGKLLEVLGNGGEKTRSASVGG